MNATIDDPTIELEKEVEGLTKQVNDLMKTNQELQEDIKILQVKIVDDTAALNQKITNLQQSLKEKKDEVLANLTVGDCLRKIWEIITSGKINK